MPLIYERPDIEPQGVVASSDLKAQELTPKTEVLVINRGRTPYTDKYDGRDWTIPPGVWAVIYEVANHFRERSVVPGSRDPITGDQQVFIAILGQDPPERCEPFSDEECERYGMAVEALDRSHMEGDAKNVQTIKTSAARARMVGRGRRSDISVQENASTDPAPGAMDAPVGGDAARAGRGDVDE